MYIPKAFEVTDRRQLLEFMRHHSFGILFSQSMGTPFATHLPFLIHEGAEAETLSLSSHMAKANPHWRDLDGQDVLVVFPGPHAFISSTWYQEDHVVPTWNYAAVHVHGTFAKIDDSEALKQILRDMLAFYEPHSTVSERLSESFFDKLTHGIVGFQIKVESVEGKWKLNQNHSPERQQRVIAALQETNDPQSQEIARLMEANLSNRGEEGNE